VGTAEGFVCVVALIYTIECCHCLLVYHKLMVINVSRGCGRKTREHEDRRELVRQSVDYRKGPNPNMSNIHGQSQVHPRGHHCQWHDAKDISLVVVGKSISVSCAVLLAIIQVNTRYIAELTYELLTHRMMMCPRQSCLADHKGPRC